MIASDTTGRRWRFGAPPKNPTKLALTAIAVGVILAALSWLTLDNLYLALKALELDGTAATIILVILGIGALYPLRPACRSIARARSSRRALEQNDLVNARIDTAASRDAAWISISLSVALAIVLIVVEFFIANDLAVSRTFFLLPLMWETLPLILEAFITNIYIFLIAEVLVLVVGLIVAIARFTPGEAGRPIRALAVIYTDIFRGLPAIINIYLVGFGISLTGLPILKDCSQETFAIIALTLTNSAYVAEIYRAGIESIHWSQIAGARSLGLTYMQTMRFVIVPQAVRRIIPPMLNSFISLQKDTALVNIIGAMDAFNQAKIIASNHFNLSAVTTVAIIFVVITIPQARLVDRLVERRRLAGGM
ncbi:MAG: amino acid ABC transporter permease [Rhodospirillaceae bacterium]|nr:MAG: amino acid ABC transporter permease [Rhodospirillaceae bacterium]